jgi:hypothetical protein
MDFNSPMVNTLLTLDKKYPLVYTILTGITYEMKKSLNY